MRHLFTTGDRLPPVFVKVGGSRQQFQIAGDGQLRVLLVVDDFQFQLAIDTLSLPHGQRRLGHVFDRTVGPVDRADEGNSSALPMVATLGLKPCCAACAQKVAKSGGIITPVTISQPAAFKALLRLVKSLFRG